MRLIRFRAYITSVFFTMNGLLLLLVFGVLAVILRHNLFVETREQLGNVVQLGALGLPVAQVKELKGLLPTQPLTPEYSLKVEAGPAFRQVSDSLNFLRDSHSGLVLFAYILTPGPQPGSALFLADADTLKARQDLHRVGSSDMPLTPYGQPYDISQLPTVLSAFSDKRLTIGTQFVPDPAFNTNSLMGLAPIVDPQTGELVAYLGADISDARFNSFTTQFFLTASLVSGILLILNLIISLLLAQGLSKPLKRLSQAAQALGSGDFLVRSRSKSFIQEIHELSQNFNQTATALEDYSQRWRTLNNAFERFVPKDLIQMVNSEGWTRIKLGEQSQSHVTILFLGIYDFDRLVRGMAPHEVFGFVNGLMMRIAPLIREFGGVVDKFLGRGIMAVFPNSADQAVQAAIRILSMVVMLNLERREARRDRLSLGIGIHSGSVMTGTIGDNQFMSATVISDAVNLASRVEGLNHRFGTHLLITKDTLDQIKDLDEFNIRYLGYTQVKGRIETVGTYEVFDADAAELFETKMQSREHIEHIMRCLNRGELTEAAAFTEQLLPLYPSDPVLQYLHRELVSGVCHD